MRTLNPEELFIDYLGVTWVCVSGRSASAFSSAGASRRHPGRNGNDALLPVNEDRSLTDALIPHNAPVKLASQAPSARKPVA